MQHNRNDALQGRRRSSASHALPTAEPPQISSEQAEKVERQAIRRLFDVLHERDIAYCHWKSNIRLAATLAGEEDIDLLVDRHCAGAFQSALADCDFKLTNSRAGSGHPGVFHALALDESTGQLFDVHAYHQIISGDSLVKAYRLPLEHVLLASARRLHGVKVPAADAELLAFALRVMLKHVHPVEIYMVNRDYASVAAEIEWLLQSADVDRAAELCAQVLPEISKELFQSAVRSVHCRSALWSRIATGFRLSRRLNRRRRIGVLHAELSRLRRTALLLRGRLRKEKTLSLQTGGMVVAFVGPKATGKSTLITELSRRLGRHLQVRSVHVGKPPPTLLTFFPRLLTPLARRLFSGERSGEYQKPERRKTDRFSLLYVLRMAMLAYDRRALLRKTSRVASNTIVLCDRYPSETIGAIDSSCFSDAAIARCTSPLNRWLMQKERALSRNLPKPQLVVRLSAPIAMTIERDASRIKQGGPDAIAIESRWDLETQAEFPGVETLRIDTSRPLDETIRATAKAVWASL